MTNVRRRIITALFLVFIMTTFLTVTVYADVNGTIPPAATTPEATKPSIDGEERMDTMGIEIMKWYKAFRACIIPLLICQYASDGLQIACNGLLKKGEYKLDAIKTHMLYVTLAALVIIFLPRILGWSRDLFESGAWKPPSTTY